MRIDPTEPRDPCRGTFAASRPFLDPRCEYPAGAGTLATQPPNGIRGSSWVAVLASGFVAADGLVQCLGCGFVDGRHQITGRGLLDHVTGSGYTVQFALLDFVMQPS